MKELLNRIKTTVEFLKDGQAFDVGGILMGMESSKDMFVSAASKYQSRKDLTKEIVRGELNEIKSYFFEMAGASNELRSFIKDKNISFRLGVNDTKAAIPICKERNGTIEWMITIRD